ncbi:DUF998 domain-containing protein [Antiquaquibacter oligotrophicus]|uniref:DUF998 domain-containing protein n=1 Tax=Antiquaquibacter oligotrophicus TaxID=2880260 RepID=UPI002AC9D119|nr:DUF998 domain-containing protein [Antiquaquibacter oligotrophicus]UDF14115.1 DUF998 domain-containing protein [Antiquaquibacter oligotrophicus]
MTLESGIGILLSVGALAVAGFLAALHVLPTGLSPIRNPVSQYALTRYGRLYRGATLAAGFTGVVAAGLLLLRYSGVAAMVTTVLLLVFAVARLLIGFFPMDAPAAPRTRTGRTHNFLAFAAFGAVTAAAFVAGGAFHDNGEPTLATLSTAAGVVMAVGTVGMLVTARSKRGFGLAERFIYLGFIAWFLVVGISAATTA